MKINYSYEQTEEETNSQNKAIETVVDKILGFGEKMFNLMIADKNASSQRLETSELIQSINMLTRKVESLETRVNSTRDYKFSK